MARKTFNFSLDNDGFDAVVVQGPVCRKVVVYENARASTTDILVRAPTDSDLSVRKVEGEKVEFVAYKSFLPGETVGYLQTAEVGAITVAQEED